jgi:hypothetical protein
VTWNGASLDADAAQLPESALRLACHETGCFVGVSSNDLLQGAGLAVPASDAVVAFDGVELAPVLTSPHAAWDFVLDALATTPDGGQFTLGGRFTGSAVLPFGSDLTLPAKDGAVVMTADAGGVVSDAFWLVRFAESNPWTPDCCANPAVSAVLGGLAMIGDDRVVGGARFRDELALIDDAPLDSGPPFESFTTLCSIVNDNSDFRWGVFFDVPLSGGGEPKSECRYLQTTPPAKEIGIRFETRAVAGAGDFVLHAGQYTNANPDGLTFSIAQPNGTNPKMLPPTGSAFAPFVSRVTVAEGGIQPTFADGLALPGAIEAAAILPSGEWLACGTAAGAPLGAIPGGCAGLEAGSLFVIFGGADVEGCAPLGAAGRCRAATATAGGFVVASVEEGAGGVASTLFELGASKQVERSVTAGQTVIDTLGRLGDDVLVGGSFTGELDHERPRGGAGDWDLFIARWPPP